MATELRNKRITVVGLAREGIALCRFLAAQGAHVTVSDMKEANALGPQLAQVADLPLRLSLGGHRIDDVLDADLLCLSPGVPPDIELVQVARARSIPVSSATALFFERCRARIIGITGSSGKTTTTALVGAMLAAAGRSVTVGGNIGKPLIEQVDDFSSGDWVVLELSSFQLEPMQQSPHIAVITNLAPDHFDRHPSFGQYVDAKSQIIRHQNPADYAVLNRNDNNVRNIAHLTPARPVPFSMGSVPGPDGAFWDEATICVRWNGRQKHLLTTVEVPLRGPHNLANVCAAAAAALAAHVPVGAMAQAIRSFHTLPHRLESVGEVDGALYVDDSIATTPFRAMAGIQSFSQPILLLAGGRGKRLPLDAWAGLVRDRCRVIVLFGEAGEEMASALAGAGNTPLVILHAPVLSDAIRLAHSLARPGDVVLLSPAATSFDEFADYAARGDAFRRVVATLATNHAATAPPVAAAGSPQ
ncbi:MAG: UDP-N-acetylmuramoyl-L-alanine--D-glutamate ligase [Chloroflexi bacterium]|nr:UDP-N-acetylmuramoyl-L-alanine--D-glutamate ligase [Chloroflexota bacterium]